jgi:hypothetical protein
VGVPRRGIGATGESVRKRGKRKGKRKRKRKKNKEKEKGKREGEGKIGKILGKTRKN